MKKKCFPRGLKNAGLENLFNERFGKKRKLLFKTPEKLCIKMGAAPGLRTLAYLTLYPAIYLFPQERSE